MIDWISVEEKLPDSNRKILIRDCNGFITTGRYSRYYEGKGIWAYAFGASSLKGTGHLEEITHWSENKKEMKNIFDTWGLNCGGLLVVVGVHCQSLPDILAGGIFMAYFVYKQGKQT